MYDIPVLDTHLKDTIIRCQNATESLSHTHVSSDKRSRTVSPQSQLTILPIKPIKIGVREIMCPPGKSSSYQCIELLLRERLSAAAFTTAIGPEDLSMSVKHNHQKFYINLTAEARVRCWAGNTHFERLIDPKDVKTQHHPTVAMLDRELRKAIKAFEEITTTEKMNDTQSRTSVDDVKPGDGTLVQSCLKQDAIRQAAVLETDSRAAATVCTSDTAFTGNQDEAERVERGVADNANVSIGDEYVILNKHEAGRMVKIAADFDKVPATDTHHPTNQDEAERIEKGAVDAAKTVMNATAHGNNRTPNIMSLFAASTFLHSRTIADSRASDAGEEAKDCDWDLIDATEALESS